MKHKHHDLLLQLAADPSARFEILHEGEWISARQPNPYFSEECEYRRTTTEHKNAHILRALAENSEVAIEVMYNGSWVSVNHPIGLCVDGPDELRLKPKFVPFAVGAFVRSNDGDVTLIVTDKRNVNNDTFSGTVLIDDSDMYDPGHNSTNWACDQFTTTDTPILKGK